MNAPFDPKKVLSNQKLLDPTKSALHIAEDTSAILNTLAPVLLCVINSFESYDLTEENAKVMLMVAANIANKTLQELNQAEEAGFSSTLDLQQQIDGIIVGSQEISRFYLNKDYTLRALYGFYYAAQNIDEELSNRISQFPGTY